MIFIIFFPKGLTSFPMHTAKLFRFSFQSEYLWLPQCSCWKLDFRIYRALVDYAVHHCSWKDEHFVISRWKMEKVQRIYLNPN